MHLLLASLITAFSALVIYAIGLQFLTRSRSIFLALLFAFATSAWSTASRDLWQHTFSVLFLAVALYLILLARKRPPAVQFAGVFLALAYIARPTNSIPVLLLTVYVALEYRKYLPGYLRRRAARRAALLRVQPVDLRPMAAALLQPRQAGPLWAEP